MYAVDLVHRSVCLTVILALSVPSPAGSRSPSHVKAGMCLTIMHPQSNTLHSSLRFLEHEEPLNCYFRISSLTKRSHRYTSPCFRILQAWRLASPSFPFIMVPFLQMFLADSLQELTISFPHYEKRAAFQLVNDVVSFLSEASRVAPLITSLTINCDDWNNLHPVMAEKVYDAVTQFTLTKFSGSILALTYHCVKALSKQANLKEMVFTWDFTNDDYWHGGKIPFSPPTFVVPLQSGAFKKLATFHGRLSLHCVEALFGICPFPSLQDLKLELVLQNDSKELRHCLALTCHACPVLKKLAIVWYDDVPDETTIGIPPYLSLSAGLDYLSPLHALESGCPTPLAPRLQQSRTS